MARLQGEPVYRLVLTGRDERGRPIYQREQLSAVVIPESTALEQGDGGEVVALATARLTLLFLEFITVEAGEEFEVRGDSYTADGDSFDHRSAFGTNRGGTQVTLVSEEVAE